VIVAQPDLAVAFEAIRAAGPALPAKEVANFVTGDYGRAINELGQRTPDGLAGKSSAAELADLLGRVAAGELSRTNAREVFAAHLVTGEAVASIVSTKGLRQISDSSALGAAIDSVLDANQAAVADHHAGKPALGFLVGQVMKATRGQANAELVGQLLWERLDGAGKDGS